MTLKCIQDSPVGPEDNLEVDGQNISEVIIVGRAIARSEEQMRVQFEVNDGTATFKVIFYQKDANTVPAALKGFEYKPQAYVKVFGNVRVYKEEKAIVGTFIKRITDFKEVTNHFLNVFVCQQIRQQGILTAKELGGGKAGDK